MTMLSGIDPIWFMLAAIALPLVAMLAVALSKPVPFLRDTWSFLAAIVTFGANLCLAPTVMAGEEVTITLTEIAPGLSISFTAEPLGLLFALLSSGLWILNSLYAAGYMRAKKEPDHTRFFAFIALAIATAQATAYAGDLFTLFLAYEALSLSTYPLVAHRGDKEARGGANIYLAMLMGASLVFFLPAIIWTGVIAGGLSFDPNGLLPDSTAASTVVFLSILFAFGTAKAALFPLHGWLPKAMVAPAPVSALLHAVAVVKAGVFVILKLTTYVFGLDLLADTGAFDWLVAVASFSLVYAGILAMLQDNLKARLAYSTVSQLAYITLGAAMAHAYGITGGTLQMLFHGLAKITLFMSAGAIYVASGKILLSETGGLGRKLPWLYGAILVSSLSIVALSPLPGDWVKYYLSLAAAEAKYDYVVYVLLGASLLAFGYLIPIFVQGVFGKVPEAAKGPRGTPWPKARVPFLCIAPPVITAALCLLASAFMVEPVKAVLKPLLGG